MKKQIVINNSKRYVLFLAALFYLIILGSCMPEMIAERFSTSERTEEPVITALIPESVPEIESLSDSNMILESGNYWSAGVPGFGENALSAFVGVYRIPEKEETVKVWLTMEFIYYDGWTSRNSIPGILLQEKMGNEGRIVASNINNNWTAVMQFPVNAGISKDDEDRIIMDLVGKLSGFSGLGQNVSLPALIPY